MSNLLCTTTKKFDHKVKPAYNKSTLFTMAERLLTPQQELFLAYYTNPKSETFSNAKQTALKVGYSLEYAENITALMPEWLSDNIGLLKRLKKAEKVLDETLEMDTKDPVTNKTDSSLQKTKADVAKFIASTVGKSTYSTRTELTGQNGGPINISQVLDKLDNGQETSGQTVETLPPVQNS